MCVKRLLIAVIIFLSLPVHGHVGDRVIPIFEITDDMLGQIDLKDGSNTEWEDFHEASLTPLDFPVRKGPMEALVILWMILQTSTSGSGWDGTPHTSEFT